MMTNRLYYGDNLEILRKEIRDESVDLIYLDPPFNSKRDYNLLFKTPKGQQSDAQITAFEDSWHWGPQAEREFYELQAASAGMYESPHHGAFPKLQILTIEGLLSGKEHAQFPDMAYGAQTFKHAKKEEGAQQQKGLF